MTTAYKVGDLVRIVANTSEHYFSIGEIVEVRSVTKKRVIESARRPNTNDNNINDWWYLRDEEVEAYNEEI